ncbi:Rho GTPase-activating protein 26, partial [Paragonimus heterotremus]
ASPSLFLLYIYLLFTVYFYLFSELHLAVCDFAVSISTFSAGSATPPPDVTTNRQSGKSDGRATPEVAETDDEVTMKTAFAEFAKIIQGVEEARSTMLEPIRSIVLTEINELRTVWLAGQKTDPKAFLKETTSFCQKLEKYVSIKHKESTAEVDEQMLQDRQKFISHAFEHVTNIHEAEELKKSKFVQTISLFMHMLGNFHHQAYEHFQDAQRQLAAINIAAQRSSENFRQICDETKELKEKLLKTPWEKIQSIDSASFREGYLFIPVKKAMTTLWIKHFCVYSRDVKSLYITPYTQGRASDLTTESYSVHSCVRRSTDSIDRRFCFDVETANRSTPLTLQAQSFADLQEWLRIMDGKEPLYADRLLVTEDPDITRLNKQTYEFLLNLLAAVETNDLRTQGLYRISGVKSKIAALVRQAMSPTGVSSSTLLACDIHLLTGAVKHFVRHLDEPLMTYSLHYSFLNAIKKNPADRLQELGRLLGQLPSQNREALKALIVHLAKVSAESRFNNMTPSNLGIVFAPSLLRSPEETVAAIMNTKFASTAIELMIENHAALFGSNSSTTGCTVSTVIPTRPAALVEPIYVTPITASSLKNQPDFTAHLNVDPSSPTKSVLTAPLLAPSSPNHTSSEPSTTSVRPCGDQASPGCVTQPKPPIPRRTHSSNIFRGDVLNRCGELSRRPSAMRPLDSNFKSPPSLSLNQIEEQCESTNTQNVSLANCLKKDDDSSAHPQPLPRTHVCYSRSFMGLPINSPPDSQLPSNTPIPRR